MNENYMNDIYEVLNTEDVEYNEDGVVYLDEPCDDFGFEYDEALVWGDDITYLDEPVEEEFNLDLGEGFIPLYQTEIIQEELIVIDENYILDEFEEDLVENYVRPTTVRESYKNSYEPMNEQTMDYSLDEIYNILNDGYEDINLDIDKAESIIHFQTQEKLSEELHVSNMSEEDMKLSTDIAKEHLDNVKACDGISLYDDVDKPEDDTSWVDGDDLFGNDINVIIAEEPNKEVEENDFVAGKFEDWLNQQNQ